MCVCVCGVTGAVFSGCVVSRASREMVSVLCCVVLSGCIVSRASSSRDGISVVLSGCVVLCCVGCVVVVVSSAGYPETRNHWNRWRIKEMQQRGSHSEQ